MTFVSLQRFQRRDLTKKTRSRIYARTSHPSKHNPCEHVSGSVMVRDCSFFYSFVGFSTAFRPARVHGPQGEGSPPFGGGEVVRSERCRVGKWPDRVQHGRRGGPITEGRPFSPLPVERDRRPRARQYENTIIIMPPSRAHDNAGNAWVAVEGRARRRTRGKYASVCVCVLPTVVVERGGYRNPPTPV